MGIPRRTVLEKSKGRRPAIPVFRLGKIFKYHPRTIIAKLAQDAGVNPELIAASFGFPPAPLDTAPSHRID
jgi:hypothetical protein